jgi:hypothetical protein
LLVAQCASAFSFAIEQKRTSTELTQGESIVLIPGAMTGIETWGPVGYWRLCSPHSIALMEWEVRFVQRVLRPNDAQKELLNELSVASRTAKIRDRVILSKGNHQNHGRCSSNHGEASKGPARCLKCCQTRVPAFLFLSRGSPKSYPRSARAGSKRVALVSTSAFRAYSRPRRGNSFNEYRPPDAANARLLSVAGRAKPGEAFPAQFENRQLTPLFCRRPRVTPPKTHSPNRVCP